MASSSSSSVSVLASQSWNYDVFLSFRGEDTRKTFVDHLYTALHQQGIHTYKDDVTLPRGESISPSLLKAIEDSQIAVIIFSKNYANSTWCLDELTHIMECRKQKKQIVMPIFYDVEPSDVRKQKRTYKEAFDKHEMENKKKNKYWGQAFVNGIRGWFSTPQEQPELENRAKVDTWREALVEASNISGWETKHISNGHEAQGIKKIVDEISQRLKLVTSGADENLIGMRTRVKALKSKLQIESGGVRMVGIWGVGGGGKTTLASSIYEEISRIYEGCCFVNNIREESSKIGLEKLQEKILSGILKQVQEGHMIKARLSHKKVLIVLDDVDHLDQLKALVGSHDWFGEGSRILVTTRDEHLLKAHGVDVIHNISLLNHDEAVTLFRKHANRDYTPMEDFGQLSEEVVCYAGGLPLALNVLGCFLCDKNISQWRSALARLKEIPDDDILGKLKISFNGLKQVEKDLFLDIACFLRWEDKDDAMERLDACGFHAVIGVEVLRQKALIVIDEFGRFDMHDLVQEMGHYIVRGEHPKNPEKHSRVWTMEDVRRILSMDATMKLDNIEAIHLNRYSVSYEESQRFLQVAGNMNKLRWIDLHCYGQNNKERDEIALPLPENFPPGEICFLKIQGRGSIRQQQLWEGSKYLPNLKQMELVALPNLIKIPDLSGLANLETFKLCECPCLEEIHPSTGCLERLVLVSIVYCPSLRKFPSITRIKKLETLEFYNCENLGIISQQDNLGDVDLDNTSGKEVASSACTNFFVVCWTCGRSSPPGVECCLPHHYNINRHRRRLWFIHNALRKLDLSRCSLGDEEIGSDVWELPNLEQLDLLHNPLISRLDFSILRLPRLKRLDVSFCEGLVEMSELPSSIAVVIADGCVSLKSFGDISNCKWLWKVSLWGENKLDQLFVDSLIHSMFQGNAIEHHFINVLLEYHLPKRFEGRLFWSNTFRLHLPDDWYNGFCGFLICFVTNMDAPCVTINMMKQEDPPPFDLSQESDEAVEHLRDDREGVSTCVGYVSFNSLRHTTSTLLTSSYNIISFSIKDLNDDDHHAYVGAELIPRKSKRDEVQAIDCSEFWDKKSQDEEFVDRFTIQQCDLDSSIEISWKPFVYEP